jgi:hypothetical protein
VAIVAVLVAGLGHPDAWAQGARIGVIGGLNHATVTGGSGATTSARHWFVAGASVAGQLTPFLALQIEALYSRKGAARSQLFPCTDFAACGCPPTVFCVSADPGTFRTVTELGFLEFPLLARFELPALRHRLIRPFVVAGPSVAIRIGCRVRTDSGGPEFSNPCTAGSGEPEYNDSDFGVVVGGGASVGDFDLGARWTRGLTAVQPNATGGFSDLSGSHTSTLSFTVNYRIRFSR